LPLPAKLPVLTAMKWQNKYLTFAIDVAVIAFPLPTDKKKNILISFFERSQYFAEVPHQRIAVFTEPQCIVDSRWFRFLGVRKQAPQFPTVFFRVEILEITVDEPQLYHFRRMPFPIRNALVSVILKNFKNFRTIWQDVFIPML
jgi:hypothetical protein